MAEGPSLSRLADGERSSKSTKNIVSEEVRKHHVELQLVEEILVPSEESVTVGDNNASVLSEEPTVPECAVCLQTCVYPARLPCSHIFCFLCLKGIASQSRRCAMCRQDIPPDYLEHPDLVLPPPLPSDNSKKIDSSSIDDVYQWFYEGRNGWWQYDERTSGELESSYKQGNRNCELLIAGFLYTANFDSMLQVRKNEQSRYRRIKRDLSTIPKKGVAGIRTQLSDDSLVERMSNLSISTASLDLQQFENTETTSTDSNTSEESSLSRIVNDV